MVNLIQVVNYTLFALSHENGSRIESHKRVSEGEAEILCTIRNTYGGRGGEQMKGPSMYEEHVLIITE